MSVSSLRGFFKGNFVGFSAAFSPIILALSFLALVGAEGRASLPTKAAVSSTTGGRIVLRQMFPFNNGYIDRRQRTAMRNLVVRAWVDSVSIPGNGTAEAYLNFYRYSNPMGIVGKFGPDDRTTSYVFSCRGVVGKAQIAWGVSRFRENGLQGCAEGMEFSNNSPAGSVSSFESQSPGSYAAFSKALNLASDHLAEGVIRYCSATSDNGEDWDFSISQEDWFDLFSASLSPCMEALQLCENNSSGGCSLASQGEWAIDEPELTASLRCDNDRSFAHSNLSGSDVEASLRQLQAQANLEFAETGQTPRCVPHVIESDAIIAQPYGGEATKIEATGTEAEIIIDALAGATFIRSAADPEGKLILKGEAYVYDIPSQTSIVIDSTNDADPLECDEFRIPGDPNADEFADICDQGNVAQAAPEWIQYAVNSREEGQLRSLTKQTINDIEPVSPPSGPQTPYATLQLPPSWTTDLTVAPGELGEKITAPGEPGTNISNTTDFFALNIVSSDSNSNFEIIQYVSVRRTRISDFTRSNLTGDDIKNLDQLVALYPELESQRVNLFDGEALLEMDSYIPPVSYRAPILSAYYTFIDGDYVYRVLFETFGDNQIAGEIISRREELDQELRTIAQSFRLANNQ